MRLMSSKCVKVVEAADHTKFQLAPQRMAVRGHPLTPLPSLHSQGYSSTVFEDTEEVSAYV